MRKFALFCVYCLFSITLFAAKPAPEPVNENAFLVQKEIAVWPTDKTYDSAVSVYLVFNIGSLRLFRLCNAALYGGNYVGRVQQLAGPGPGAA